MRNDSPVGVRQKNYGDACATARTEIRSELARLLPDGVVRREQVERLTQTFLHIMHTMPPWSLRSIADAIDPSLPET